MASCVRVLLLSLLAFGQHAKALSYRGSSDIKPYFELPENFPRNHKPALASSSYENSALLGGSQGSYGPSYIESGSSESLKPIAATSAGGYGGSYGRQVNSYSPEGSVSSYRPGLLMGQKPRQTPQQPHYQINPNTNGVPQTKAGMWDIAVPPNGKRSEMHSGNPAKPQPQRPPTYPAQPQRPPTYPAQPQRPPTYPAQPQRPPTYPAQPQRPPTYPAQPQRPPTYPAQPQRPPTYPAQPQRPPTYPAQPQRPPTYTAKPQLQQPSYGVTQSKAGMWDSAPSGKRSEMHSGNPAKPQPQRPPTYPAQPQRPPTYPAQPQRPPTYTAKPQLQQPSYGVTQSKAGMWDSALSGKRSEIQSGNPSKAQAQPQRPPTYPAQPQRPPTYTAKPQLQQPSYGVTQSKAGMWDSALSGKRSEIQSGNPSKPQAQAQPRAYLAKPQAQAQPRAYLAKPQAQAQRPPTYPAQAQRPPTYPAQAQRPPTYPAQAQRPPTYRAKPQLQKPSYGVSQSKAGMWDFALSGKSSEMHSGNPAKPQPQRPPTYPAQPQRPPTYTAKPQLQQPGYGVTQSKAGMWDSALSRKRSEIQSGNPSQAQAQPRAYLAKPPAQAQRPPTYPAQAQRPPTYRAKPQLQKPSYGVSQSKAGMWDFALSGKSSEMQSGNLAKPQAQPQRPPTYPAQPQRPPTYTAKPQLQQPSYGVSQSKAAMWDFALSGKSSEMQSGNLDKPQAQPQRPPTYPAQPQRPPTYTAKPQLQQPSYGVSQSKAGMWDFALSQKGVASGSTDLNPQTTVNLRSSRPYPRAPAYQPQWLQQVPVYNRLR